MTKHPAMRRSFFLKVVGGLMATAVLAWAQPSVEMMAREQAALRNDVRLLEQRLGELAMTVEDLRRENSSLQARTSQSFVTVTQLNEAVADMNRALQAGLASQKRDVLQQVAGQMERLGKQTQAALDALARGQATRPAVQTDFKDDFPKQGVNYTVQAGDTLSGIAQKMNSSVSDIINANRITDPTKLRVGQTLFIPQGK